MIVKPKIRGFICITSHPDGCAANVQEQIDYVKSQPKVEGGPNNVLVIGSSAGYGLASRIVPAFSSGANTLGLFFEKPGSEKRTGSAGWYNTAAFEKAATAEGLFAKSLNGDAFSHEMKKQAIDIIKADMGKIDLVVYSLASPRRTDPDTGEIVGYADQRRNRWRDRPSRRQERRRRRLDQLLGDYDAERDYNDGVVIERVPDSELQRRPQQTERGFFLDQLDERRRQEAERTRRNQNRAIVREELPAASEPNQRNPEVLRRKKHWAPQKIQTHLPPPNLLQPL